MSASHSRAADSTSVLSTVCSSNVERLMTLSTSAVAVCWLQRFAQLVEQPRVLDGDDGLRGEVGEQLDLLVAKRAEPPAGYMLMTPISSSSLSMGTTKGASAG